MIQSNLCLDWNHQIKSRLNLTKQYLFLTPNAIEHDHKTSPKEASFFSSLGQTPRLESIHYLLTLLNQITFDTIKPSHDRWQSNLCLDWQDQIK